MSDMGGPWQMNAAIYSSCQSEGLATRNYSVQAPLTIADWQYILTLDPPRPTPVQDVSY